MTKELSPELWATNFNKILDTIYGTDRFPVKTERLALGFSQEIFPDDPITDILGGSLPGFEGALFPAQNSKKGWGIIYNNSIASPGRINFTIAHEFGHYLLHRLRYPDGVKCTKEDMRTWNSEYKQIENQANSFAVNFLMPFDDFRKQISARKKPDLKLLGMCANRYEVSLTGFNIALAAVYRASICFGRLERRVHLVGKIKRTPLTILAHSLRQQISHPFQSQITPLPLGGKLPKKTMEFLKSTPEYGLKRPVKKWSFFQINMILQSHCCT